MRRIKLLKGVEEVSMPPNGSSDANAVYLKACGKRIYDLPITG